MVMVLVDFAYCWSGIGKSLHTACKSGLFFPFSFLVEIGFLLNMLQKYGWGVVGVKPLFEVAPAKGCQTITINP